MEVNIVEANIKRIMRIQSNSIWKKLFMSQDYYRKKTLEIIDKYNGIEEAGLTKVFTL